MTYPDFLVLNAGTRIASIYVQEINMKAFKKATAWTTTLGTLTFLVWGAMNSPVLNKTAFMKNKFNIQFAKRLDEMNGDYKAGRAAASINKSKWNKLTVDSIKETIAAIDKKKPEVAPKVETPQAEPAVTGTLSLELTGGLYNKKPLKNKDQFYGTAEISDGVIEEVIVGLPGGEEIAINTTNERMNGNVFSYEDSQTGELKSGLLYNVIPQSEEKRDSDGKIIKKAQPGVYMITLTNDSAYPGLRLEFKTKGGEVDQSYQDENQNWAADSYNNDDDNYARNEEPTERDNYQDENSQPQAQSYEFTF